jgi:hypothetical protein
MAVAIVVRRWLLLSSLLLFVLVACLRHRGMIAAVDVQTNNP